MTAARKAVTLSSRYRGERGLAGAVLRPREGKAGSRLTTRRRPPARMQFLQQPSYTWRKEGPSCQVRRVPDAGFSLQRSGHIGREATPHLVNREFAALLIADPRNMAIHIEDIPATGHMVE